MIYLTKEITTDHGVNANHHELILKAVELAGNGDYVFSNIEMHVYSNKAAFDADSKFMDCFIADLIFTVSQADRDAEADTKDWIRAKKALIKKITASVLGDGGETNLFRNKDGVINYVGCEV